MAIIIPEKINAHPMSSVVEGRDDLALIEYEKLSPNQKIFFKSSYELAQAYNNQQIFLENMI